MDGNTAARLAAQALAARRGAHATKEQYAALAEYLYAHADEIHEQLVKLRSESLREPNAILVPDQFWQSAYDSTYRGLALVTDHLADDDRGLPRVFTTFLPRERSQDLGIDTPRPQGRERPDDR